MYEKLFIIVKDRKFESQNKTMLFMDKKYKKKIFYLLLYYYYY